MEIILGTLIILLINAGMFFLLYRQVQNENKKQLKKIKDVVNAELQDFFSNVYLNEGVQEFSDGNFDNVHTDEEDEERELELELVNDDEVKNEEDEVEMMMVYPYEKIKKPKVH